MFIRESEENCNKYIYTDLANTGKCQICIKNGNIIQSCFLNCLKNGCKSTVYNSSQCINNCCSSATVDNNQFTNLCYNNHLVSNSQNSMHPRTIGFITFIIISIPLIFGIIFCCCSPNCCKKQYNNQHREPQIGSAQSISKKNLDNNQIFQDKGKIKNFIINTNQICTICLQNSTNLMTKCGHYFHAVCLGSWLDRNVKCPLCFTKDFNPTIVFCTSCHYRVYGLKIGMNFGYNQNEMRKYKNIVCEICQQTKNQKVEQI